MKLRIILPNLSPSNMVPSKIVCFVMGRVNPNLKTSQKNLLENLYTIVEVMKEFIAVSTNKSIQLTKALVFNFFSYSPILPTSGNLMKTGTRKR